MFNFPKWLIASLLCLAYSITCAGPQREEHLADSVRIAMSSAVADLPPPTPYLPTGEEEEQEEQQSRRKQQEQTRKRRSKEEGDRLDKKK